MCAAKEDALDDRSTYQNEPEVISYHTLFLITFFEQVTVVEIRKGYTVVCSF